MLPLLAARFALRLRLAAPQQLGSRATRCLRKRTPPASSLAWRLRRRRRRALRAALLQLPNDLQLLVCEFLASDDLINLERVHAELARIVNTDDLWRRLTSAELGAAPAMAPPSVSGLSSPPNRRRFFALKLDSLERDAAHRSPRAHHQE
jgi:uncharacterized protein with von Willebrand factor type A (vWA) domain